MKKRMAIVIWIVAAFLVLSLTKDLFIKFSVEKAVGLVTGLKIEIKSLNVGIFRTAVRIKGLKIFNPGQFKDRVMADMPEIYVDYDLPAVFAHTVHLEYLKLNLKEFIVVKNAAGELNLNSLKVVTAGKEGVKPKVQGKAPNIKIDNFELKIGKAFYKDYSGGGAPSVKEFNVNIDERYTNVDDLYTVVSIIVVKALANTSIAGMANFDVNGLQGTVMKGLSSATNAAGKAASTAHQALQSTTQGAPEAVKNANETVNKAAGAIGGFFKDALRSDNK